MVPVVLGTRCSIKPERTMLNCLGEETLILIKKVRVEIILTNRRNNNSKPTEEEIKQILKMSVMVKRSIGPIILGQYQ